MIDAFMARAAADILPDLGDSFAGDLASVLRKLADILETPLGPALIAVATEIRAKSGTDYSRVYFDRRMEQLEPMFAAAIARGELPARIDREALFTFAAGPIYFRMFIAGRPVEDDFINSVVTSVCWLYCSPSAAAKMALPARSHNRLTGHALRSPRGLNLRGTSPVTAKPCIDTSHPHFVSIPDPRAEGVRAYREPDKPHPLQLAFLKTAGEHAWIEATSGLLSAGRTAEADARLAAEIAGFDGAIARLCKATAAADVALEGWDDLLPILAEWEGPPVTAITLGLTNPPDLAFEHGGSHQPDLLLGLYSDEAYPFSRATKADLLAECGKGCPAWAGAEEDVEFYCTVTGLDALNTALIHCKHRRFLRDGRDGVEGRAPGGYVEYVLGSWLLATRFLQATERAIPTTACPPAAASSPERSRSTPISSPCSVPTSLPAPRPSPPPHRPTQRSPRSPSSHGCRARIRPRMPSLTASRSASALRPQSPRPRSNQPAASWRACSAGSPPLI